MNRIVFNVAFAIGLAAVLWVGWGFVGASALALAMTVVIAAVYVLGALELRQFRSATAALASALAGLTEPVADLRGWLDRVPPALRNPVRLRIEGERAVLPGPALTPYLVGLLVMLGMLGTFLGMVVTFKGAVFALEGSTDLQAIRSALAAPIQGPGPVVWHLGGGRCRFGHAGAAVGPEPARAARRGPPAGQPHRDSAAPLHPEPPARADVQDPAAAGTRAARSGRQAAGADGRPGAPQPAARCATAGAAGAVSPRCHAGLYRPGQHRRRFAERQPDFCRQGRRRHHQAGGRIRDGRDRRRVHPRAHARVRQHRGAARRIERTASPHRLAAWPTTSVPPHKA